ncbi:unnamed protein product [Peronospora belbahrii]|uniref:Bromo domain-containing protein n=1 Tax=Peronospora belbahrii TaxID=622444 RepID=A0AAU9L2L3_9STRA|nr:unnamed protein product [Peronospora belbahrii]
MSSSSSSGFSDEEDTEVVALNVIAPSALELGKVMKIAQICSFCTTFRKPLRLPSFSRTELQEALLGASNSDRTHIKLLAELHFKLAREQPTAKMEKMMQDWEKTLARKMQENWRKEFTANPMGGGVTYRDLTVIERVNILDALCHWKLDTCAEIHKYIATLQQENNNEAIENLRAGEIGTDDKGVSYWYFGDECWVYAEDKPLWKLEERKPSYLVEFASAKRIRFSINFDPDQNSLAPPLRLSHKSAALVDEINQEKKEEVPLVAVKDEKQKMLDAKFDDDALSSDAVQVENEQLAVKMVKTENKETLPASAVIAVNVCTDRINTAGKDIVTETSTYRRKDMGVSCELCEQGDVKHGGAAFAGLLLSNGVAHKQYDEGFSMVDGAPNVNLAQIAAAKDPTPQINLPQVSVKARDHCEILPDNNDKTGTSVSDKNDISESPGKRLPVRVGEGNSGNFTQPCVVAIVGAKKRTIIDDDSSDSSSTDADTTEAVGHKNINREVTPSLTSRKKRKVSIAVTNSAAVLDAGTAKGDITTLSNTTVVGTATTKASKSDSVASRIKEGIPSLSKADPIGSNLKETSSPQLEILKPAALDTKEPSSPSRKNADNEVILKSKSIKMGNVIEPANPSGATSVSPTDPAAAPETFDITCESCKKCYDMRYLDPPLVERPSDEWRCFECLVNDARGWPRRRKPIARESCSLRGHNRMEESSFRKRSLSKPQSGSSFLKKSKISSNNRSSSSTKKKSSHSSSSKRKSSDSKKCSSKKSSSSSLRKHKKRKSSSSHHRHGHSHRRRRRSHHYHEEFAKLVKSFQERQEQRLGIEEARIKGNLPMAYDECPQGWRIASSTLDELRALIQSLSDGSLEQDRLKGRLILIVKDQEKFEEQRRKQQERAWNILPRRQSSRIAIGRMKNQSAQDSDAEEGYSGNDAESRRLGLRLKRRHSASDSVDGTQKHDRAWRARRRHNDSDDAMHLDNEENEVDSSGAGNWIDWSVFKGNNRCLSTVCLALVDRLLQEEASDLFSRPVDPEIDGCPNYLSVIDQPMDLGTIRSRAEANFYRKWKLFKKDIELVWQNCRTFNAPDTMVVQFANLLERLSRSMCIAAEKKGADRLNGKGSVGDGSDESENSLSDASKAESHSSVNKPWTESSASESRDSSDDGGSAHDNSDSIARSRKRSPARGPAKNLQTRARSTRSSGTRSRTRRSTRNGSSKKCQAPASSSAESFASDDDEAFSSVRKSRRQLRPKADRKVDPPTDDEESVDDDIDTKQPLPPHNEAFSPPPPPQAAQKRPKPRLVISDSSNTDDSSDSDSSSSSSSSDSVDTDSDSSPTNKHPHPPPPSSVDAPPPPLPPPPATLPENDKPVHSSPNYKAQLETAADEMKKTKTDFAGKASCTHSPTFAEFVSLAVVVFIFQRLFLR